MIYFYVWTLIIVGSIVAVPVLAFMEKSKQRKLMGPATPAPSDMAAVAEEPVMPMTEDGDMPVAEDDFGAFPAQGGDDFSAFEDFK